MKSTRRSIRDKSRYCSLSKCQAGQALVEFVVIAVVMLPLLLLLPMIGKYQDLAHATMMASRYAAFDATAYGDVDGYNGWKPPGQLADEIRRRFYSSPDAPVKTGEVASDIDAQRNVFWRDPYGNPLIRNFSDVGVSFGNDTLTQSAGFDNASGADGLPFNQTLLATANTIGLQARGIYTANVSIAVANLPSGIKSFAPLDRLDLKIKRNTSLLFDQWSAATTTRTDQRVARLVPVNTALATTEPLVSAMIGIIELPGTDLADQPSRAIGASSERRSGVVAPVFGRNSLKNWHDLVPADRILATKPTADGAP